jgi:type IV pilus assembly protein PilC
MTRFIYTAEKNGGDVYKATAEAKDRFELFAQIRREGAKVLSVVEDRSDSPWSLSYWNSRFATIPELEKVQFAQTLASMLKAGLALSRALSVISRQTKNPRFSHIVNTIEADVRQGGALNASLAKYPRVFSPLFVSMVRAGEEGGDISGALHTVGDQMERMYTLKKKVRGAMLYPSIVLIAIIGVSILMITQVVPTLAQTFRELNADLPASTQSMITISDFLINHSVVAIVGVISFIISFSLILRTMWGKRAKDWVFLHMPLIGGLVKEVNAARTARTMASLLGSGVDMLTSLSITKDVVQNTYFKEVIGEALERVQQGEPLSKTFLKSEHLYPPLVGEMMSVGEETGDIKTMLQNMAVFYEEEVSRKTKDMSTIIEPFLMLIIGGAVGFFAISMVSPIYSLSDAI